MPRQFQVWVFTVDKEGLAGKYPIGTEKHVSWETVRDSEIDSGGVGTIHSEDLQVHRGGVYRTDGRLRL